MWFLINILQSIIIIGFTIFSVFLALPLAIIGFPSGSYFLARKFWGPVVLFLVGGKVNVIGKENLDRSKAFIYSANHASNMDIPILYKGLDLDLHFIAKKELKKIPLFGWCMIAMRMIFIDRKNKASAFESMRKGGELIKKGNNVITFPEGTRSRSGKVELFRKGTFIIAKEAQIDVVPVAIIGSTRLHKPGGLKMRPGLVTVIVGKPLLAANYLDKTPEQFAHDTQTEVIKLMTAYTKE